MEPRGSGKPRLTVVIPAWNEEPALERILPPLAAVPGIEVIVVDGASTDRTAQAAARLGARVLSSPRGRGAQLDAGARAARSGTLLFLHADSRLPAGFAESIERTLDRPGVAMGAFALGFDGGHPWYRALEAATALRVRLTGTPYGDQAFFLRSETYARIGGFPPWPLLEDLALVRRLRQAARTGGPCRIVVLPERVVVSTRRYRSSGKLRTVLRNRIAATLWALHVPAPVIWRAVHVSPTGVSVTGNSSRRVGSFGDR
jgi:rSAM/selenodomain-associated transferase 2